MGDIADKIRKQATREDLSLARKLGRVGMLMHRYHTANAHRHGAVGDPLRGQGRVLALLVAKPETTQRELCYLLDMRQQSISELLAKLEDKDYVTREKSTADARVTVVRLTEAGAAAAPSPEDMERKDDAFDCLSEEERAELERLVDKLNASLSEKLEAMGIDPSAPPRPRGPHGPRGPRGPRPEGDGPQHAPERRGWDGGEGPLRQA